MDIRTVGVVGAGTMGHGIAQVFAQAGFAVRLVDLEPSMLERARAAIARSLGKFVEKGTLSAVERDETLSRLSMATSLDHLADADYVVEAIVEDVEAKRTLFGKLDAHREGGRDRGLEHLVDFDHDAGRGDGASPIACSACIS